MRNKLLHTTSLTLAAGLTVTAMAFSLTGPQSARATVVTACPANGEGGVGDIFDIGPGSYAGCTVDMDGGGGEAGNDTVNFNAGAEGPIMWGYEGGEGGDSVLNGEGGDDIFNFNGTMEGSIEAMNLGPNEGTVFIGSDGASGTINGESGNDTFDINGTALGNTGGSGTINGGDGNDVFTIDQSILGNDFEFGASGTINGGNGDDTFTVTESIIGKHSYGAIMGGGEGGEDNITLTDVIVGQNAEGEVDAGDGDDIININGHAIIGKNELGDGFVTGGEGEDTITLSGSFGEGTLQEGWETSGETGGTIIIGYVGGSDGTVTGGDDNDTITGEGVVIGNDGHGTLQGGFGDDVITLTEVVIGRSDFDETGIVHGDVYENGDYDGGEMGGDDTITLTNAVIGHEGTGKVLGGYGEDNITVNGPAIIGNHEGSYGVVDGGADNDIITLSGSMNVAVEGFFNEGLEIDENSTIIIGYDYDADGRVSGGSGNDVISVTGTVIGKNGHGVVEGNAGDDTITINNSVLGYGEAILTGIVHGDDAEGGYYLKEGPMGGDDTITVSNSIIGDGGTGKVLGGYGEDNITVNGPSIIGNQYFSYGLVDGGADNDPITLSGTMTVGEGVLESGLSIDENATIIIGNEYGSFGMVAGGSGEDNITVTGTVIGNNGEGVVQGNTGGDFISVSNSVLGHGEIEDTGVVHGDTYLTEINGLGIEEEYGVEEGPGDDIILITDSIIGGEGTGKVFGGFGNDLIIVSGSVIGEDAFGLVHGGNGTEVYEEPSINPDDDWIGITDSIIGKYATGKVNGGEGDDYIVINNSFVGYGAYSKGKVTGYSGADTIIVQGTIIGYNEGKGKVDGGSDNDTIQLNALGEGDGNDMMVTQVTSRGKVQGGPGDDIIGIETGVLLDDYATLDGDNKYFEGYNKDELKLFGSGIGTINPGVNIVNFEILRKIDPGIWFYQNDAEFKKTKIEEGTFVLGGKLRSQYTFIKPDGVLETNPEGWGGTGVIKSPYEGYAKAFNRGLISPGGAGFFGKLKIKGDYKSKYDEGGLFVDFDGLQADRLEITRSVYGDTTVFAAPSPTGTYEPTGTGPDDGMLVINACTYDCTVDGDFLLNGGSVTGGAYVYNLNRFELVEGETGSTIWRLQSDGTITPQSNTFMNALTAAQVQYRYAAQSFHQRMAELRTDGTVPGSSSIPTQFASLGPTYNLGSGSININPDLVKPNAAPQVAQGAKDATRASGPQSGRKKFQLWIRGFGGYSDVDPGVSPGGAGFDERTGGMQVGLGQMIPGYFEKGDQFHFGLIGGMSRTDVDVPGADMDINGVVGGIYGSWFSQSGWYVDAVGMAGPLDFKVSAPSFGVINQSFHGYSAGGSIEAGRGFEIGKDTILEPQAQLTYVHVDHESFSTALGTPVAAVDGDSLVGRLGARLAGTFQGEGQTRYTPFLRASVKYDFLGDNKVQVANTGLRSDVGGVTGEVGGGLTAKISDKMSLYFNAFYEKGDDIEAVQGTAGAVWTFE